MTPLLAQSMCSLSVGRALYRVGQFPSSTLVYDALQLVDLRHAVEDALLEHDARTKILTRNAIAERSRA